MPTEVLLTPSNIRRIVQKHRPKRCSLPGLRPAAVLIPLFAPPPSQRMGGDGDGSIGPGPAGTAVWLIRRPDDGTAHAGQVAFPGGKPAASDADLKATALREAGEELGLEEESVEVFGAIDDLVTVTRFRITPFVGWIPSDFQPRPNPSEVARVFQAPLSTFFSRGTKNIVRFGPLHRSVWSYSVDGEIVWGATGAILRRFGRILVAADQ